MLSNLWNFSERNKHFRIPFWPPELGTLPTAWSPESSWSGIWEHWGTFQCLFSPPAGGAIRTPLQWGHGALPRCVHPSVAEQPGSCSRCGLDVPGAGWGLERLRSRAQAAPLRTALPLHCQVLSPTPAPNLRQGPQGYTLSSFLGPAGTRGEPSFGLVEIIHWCLGTSS